MNKHDELRFVGLAKRIGIVEKKLTDPTAWPPMKEVENPHGGNCQAQQESNRPEGSTNPIPKSHKEPSDTKRKAKPWWKKSWKCVQAVGTGAAVFVAGINACQWHDANKNFALDQRAWL